MARKSIKGYAEKNYYDNTRFSGGIVATNDPLNEGYFKSLVNFDISDTGYSLQPRKGFFTTLLNAEDSDTGIFSKYALNSRRTIYFYNASTGTYIFIDFSQTIPIKKDNEDVSIPVIIEAELNIEDMYLSAASLIKNIEYPKDLDLFSIDMANFNNRAEQVLDQYNITKYIIKIPGVKNTENNNYYTNWFLFTYRTYGTTYNNITYKANTLIIEPLDFSDTVSIEMKDRNIASFRSIIPDPFQKIYSYNEAKPDGFVQSFPLVYIYDTNKEKYLLNTTDNIKDIVIRPHYTLDYPKTGEYWAYTYDIISSKKTNEFLLDLPYGTYLDESGIYKSPIYIVEDTLSGDYTSILHDETWYKLYKTHAEDRLYSNINIDGVCDDFLKDTLSLNSYGDYLKSLSFRNGTQTNSYLPDSDESKSTLVIYIMPSFKDKNYEGASMVVQPINNITDLYDIFNNKEGKSIYLRDGKSNIVHGSVNYNYIGNIPNVHSNLNNTLKGLDDVNDIISLLEKYLPVQGTSETRIYTDDYMFYVKPLNDITEPFMNSKVGVMSGTDTFLCNRICTFPSKGYDFADLCTYLRESNFSSFIFKLYTNTFALEFSKDFDINNNKQILDLFEGLDTKLNLVKSMKEEDLSKEENKIIYYVSTDLFKYETYDKNKYKGESTDIDYITDLYYRLFISSKVKDSNDSIVVHNEYIPLIEYDTTAFIHESDHTYDIPSTHWTRLLTKCKLSSTNEDLSIFYKDEDTGLLQTSYSKILDVVGHDFLQEGIGINFYLFEIPNVYTDDPAYMFHFNRSYFVSSTSLKQSRQIIYSSVSPTTMIETLTEEPRDISSASNSLIFRSAQGDHLVLYIDNKLYISEANNQHYFKYTKTFSYPEQIVKVIQYKDTLLVFTTQNLYSVYPIEVTENVESGIDAEGNKQYTQVTTIEYGSLPVLYNLLVNKKYKDAIQVYNQMVLFYSADGQMFMIKPTATIDSNTRFSIQYFNKNANDILLNYTDYIRERLRYYGYDIDNSIEQALKNINIKVSVSLNNIKIFYCVPDIMTYILVYDIINNRYYAYDTLSFTNIKHLEFIPEGELYIVEHNNQLYFTQPYVIPLQKNNNVDLSYFHGFTPEPIIAELDTGIENLNNHLKKRFKDLHIIYKNISAESLEFSLDVFIDNVPITTYINPEIQVQDSMYTVNNIYKTSTLVDLNKQMLNNNNALFDFSQFNSSKILTHKTSIISRGKTIRTKLCFKSDGVYKIQGYGLIYKEHTV